ncbi:hypothetical protein SY86_22840 [Erwinia tracheiphila]|uniref:Uncharacterized protein n=1 Tax=Erwinia tracheiphila TaxID=65700 RepID=A0A0M2KEJ4_9GAMM|nr:hypothetical protein SY86_21225 [Erwinia tracheiphila]KKF37591.1 hypothetical protein SY86_22840 [Erwinia tracheiphila]
MPGSHYLLLFRPGFYKTHGGPASRLTDSFSIDKIVFVAPDNKGGQTAEKSSLSHDLNQQSGVP